MKKIRRTKESDEHLAKKETQSLSIIIPTYNEKENLPKLIKEIFSVLKNKDIETEIVVVDDSSPDGTGQTAKELSVKYPIQVINRSAKEGLSSAVIDGIGKAKGEIIGIMDADLSHDPAVIPKMLDAIMKQKNEIVVGSRFANGGKIEDWPFIRKLISWFAVLIAFPFTKVKDRTSGYLFFRKEIIDGVDLSVKGFKIGLEIMVKGKYKRWKEVGYTFKNRKNGHSKMNFNEILQYINQIGSYFFKK